MKKMYIFVLLLASPLMGLAQKQDNGQAVLSRFFQIYESEGHAAAIRFGFSTNKWMGSNTQAMEDLIVKLDQNVALLGEYIGYEEIASRMVGSRFRAVTCFVYYDRQPLRFSFQLYRNAQGGALWNFRFDSDYDDEVEEGMKLDGAG